MKLYDIEVDRSVSKFFILQVLVKFVFRELSPKTVAAIFFGDECQIHVSSVGLPLVFKSAGKNDPDLLGSFWTFEGHIK